MCTTASTIFENCPASCSTPAAVTTTTCTGDTGCSVTTSTRPASHTSTVRTPATTAAEPASDIRWRWNGYRKSWATDPDHHERGHIQCTVSLPLDMVKEPRVGAPIVLANLRVSGGHCC